jgi:adenylate cyclase
MTEQRRLAAILVADVVGYSKLIGSDEAGTLTQLQALRSEIIEPQLAKHSGRLFKSVGDGFLVEFASAVQAVNCAKAIQEANAGGALRLRIGIHLGDVVVQGDDLMGDGVNVAARIEGVAEPSGIAMSRQVRDQVRDKVDVELVDKGEVELKNIVRPVRVFVVAGAKTAVQPAVTIPEKPTIAVLPFHNLSGDPDRDYFSEGISEDIITSLSKFREFDLIARNSSFALRDPGLGIGEIAKRLGADYVVQGSVRSDGSRVRITAQLTSVSGGANLWAERYDRELSDVFAVQDEITARIATAVDPAIRDAETKTALRKHPSDLGAWDQVLRGLWHFNQFRRASNGEARREFLAALAREPASALAHAWLAMTHVCDAWFNWTTTQAESLDQALKEVAKAVKADSQEPAAHTAAAMANFWNGRLEQAKAEADRALVLNPNAFLAHFVSGATRNYLGECEAAVAFHTKALDLNPADPLAWNCLGSFAHTLFNLGRFGEAIDCADRAIVLRHGYLFGRVVKTAALAHAGRQPEAEASLRAIMDLAPDFSLAKLAHYPFVIDSQRRQIFMGLEKAGLVPPAVLALPDKPSIAVLPFQNMSGDPEQEYFADGVVEDVINALSRFKSLFVIARNSSFTYKGRAVDIKEVGRELGVRYVLEGSVRRAANRVRITGQLIDAQSGAHIWADRFDGTFDDLFELQDRVTANVAGAVAPALSKAELEEVQRRPVRSNAYDCYLRGLIIHYGPRTRQTIEQAMALFYRAIELDADFATPYGLAANDLSICKSEGWISDARQAEAEVRRLAAQVARIGQDDAIALSGVGHALGWLCRDLDAATALIDRALLVNPNLSVAWSERAMISVGLGQHVRAIEEASRAIRLSPIDIRRWHPEMMLAYAHLMLGQHDEALSWARRGLAARPDNIPLLLAAAAAHGHLGQIDEARATIAAIRQRNPAMNLTMMPGYQIFRRAEDNDTLIDGLRRAGLPE